MLWIKKFKYHLILIFVLVLLPMMAVAVHGPDAIKGITWGYEEFTYPAGEIYCNLLGEFIPGCKFDKSNIKANFGIYDPGQEFKEVGAFAIDHYFINWNDTSSTLSKNLSKTKNSERWPLVTVEPFPSDDSTTKRQTLFTDIENGEYDVQINSVCQVFAEYDQPVFIRWGHEMENITGRYPWAQYDNAGYVNAYKYFVSKCREQVNEAFYVWSPVGNKVLANYWPGKNYVDYVGLSVYSFPEWELDSYGKIRSFKEIFNEKYARVKRFDRPVMIAEMGVTGGSTMQEVWMNEAFRNFNKYSLLKTVVYFNAIDSVEAWGNNYSVPDWRIDSVVFE